MAEGRNRAAWWHTATLEAAILNIMRRKGSKPITPKELHPMEQKPPVRVHGKGLEVLKYIFCQEQVKREEAEAKAKAKAKAKK